ncbi:MAG: hypothetical protein ACYTFD_16000 [Planctomycetota bacterium]|jgi:hypothetical protein
MRIGVLVLGSLYWEDTSNRRGWRAARLSLEQCVQVRAPVRYWRKSESRGRSFTIVLAGDAGGQGTALLVPCPREVETLDDVVKEATALWKAEAPKWRRPPLGGRDGWGTVGLLANPASNDACRPEGEWRCWAADPSYLRPVGRRIPVEQGVLQIAWPECDEEGKPTGIDLLLAAANQPEKIPPEPCAIADAWIANSRRTDTECESVRRSERYFFHNVAADIRTPDDAAIWPRMVAAGAEFLERAEYAGAIAKLQSGVG